MSINKEILFRRRGAVVVPVKGAVDKPTSARLSGVTKHQLVATAAQNIELLGYRFSEELISAALSTKLSNADLAQYFTEAVSVIRKATGASRTYKPMYPNFPEQVIDATEAYLYTNSVLHYIGDRFGLRIIPVSEIVERAPLDKARFDDLTELRVIGMTKRGASYSAAEDEFDGIFTSLLSMKSSWGATELADAKWFIAAREGDALTNLVPLNIPNKEVLASFVVAAKDAGKHDVFAESLTRAATATDVLRVAVALSGGDVSLSGAGVSAVRFASQPKYIRRALVQRLESISGGRVEQIAEDMLRNVALWKLLAHSLHIGDYIKSAPNAVAAAAIVRSNGKNSDGSRFETYTSKVEALITCAEISFANSNAKANAKDIADLVDLLAKRPGVFARRLDKVLRTAINKVDVLDAFDEVATEVATPVLWQLMGFYANRHLVAGKNPKLSRSFMPKGRASKIQVADAPLVELDGDVAEGVIERVSSALGAIYRKRSDLGKVFISDSLKDYTVPFGARSASKSLNPVGRGTRGYFDKNLNTVRFFIWWTDGNGRTDLDLSAVYLDEDFSVTGDLAYYNLRNEGGAHSGDITSAPKGAAEFIDINREKMLKRGNRYIAMMVNSFTHQSFDSLPEVFAGVMARKGSQKGEIFEPRTLHNAFDVTVPGTMAMPLVVDLEEAAFIWTDLAVTSRSRYANNVGNNESAISRAVRGIVESKTASLHDVFSSNATRGTLVSDRDEADVVVDINRGRVTINGEVVGTDQILSEWV
jgi:stress response protein SCP2